MTDCACLYGHEGDAPEFYNDRWVIARKVHTCFECQRPIEKGVRYYRATGKWDDEVRTFRFCDDCQNIAASLYCDSTYSFGTLWEDVEEQIFRERGLTVECIDKLTTTSAKEYLQERWIEFLEAR